MGAFVKVMKKKLLMTASTFPRWKDDTEPRFILDLAEAMTEYYDVTVLVPAAIGAKDKEKFGKVKVIRYHYFPIHRLETLCYPGAIVPRIKEKKVRVLLVPFLFLSLYVNLFRLMPKYDMVHAHWLIPQGIIQGLFGKKYIITGHGSDVRSLNIGPIKMLKKRCLKRASHITAVSRHLKKEINDLYSNDKTSVISMGCSLEQFDPKHRVENYFEQEDKKVVLFVGRLVEIKGVRYLIRAMKHLDAQLVIVGDGPLRGELENEAKAYTDKVKFLGARTHEQLSAIYASADLFVAPSITADNGGQEGFGLTIVEAMASGLPVIASNSGGIVDLIGNGEQGFLVEEKNSKQLADAMTLVLRNETLRKQMAKKAMEKAKEYDYKVIAGKYYQIFEGIK